MTPTFAPSDAHAGVAGNEVPRSQDADAAPVTYTCPMHPEVVRSEPGSCPECGMALRPAPAHDHGDGR